MSISTSTLNLGYSPACLHAASFADPNGILTEESIQTRQAELGDTGEVATLRRNAVLAAAGKTRTVEHICSIVNPARSGIWNEDGSLNEDRLRKLKARCITSAEGSLYLTRSIIQNFTNERRALVNRSIFPNGLAFGNLTWTWIRPFSCCWIKIPVPFTAVTDGSFDAFVKTKSDREINGEQTVSWEQISTFYDPNNVAATR